MIGDTAGAPAGRNAAWGFGYARRLHRPEEFSATLAARRVIRGERFDLHFRFDVPNAATDASVGGARLGLIVPKRLAKASSLRNAIKRQGREAFRLLSPVLPAGDLVLRLARPIKGVVARDAVQKKVWRQEIEGLLGRVAQAAAKSSPHPAAAASSASLASLASSAAGASAAGSP